MHKVFIFIAAAVLGLVTLALAADAPGGAVMADKTPDSLLGQTAPAFSLPDYEGKKHSLADYKGKIVVIDWFNYGCPVVQAYYKNKDFVASMNKALAGKKDVVWLSISSSAPGNEGSDPEGFKAAAKEFGKTNLTLHDDDGKVGHAYGAHATPTVYVINKEGKVVYAGAFDEAAGPQEAPKGSNLALAAVDAARAGKSPAVQSKKAFGCSVKYAKK
jgi:peroxiredoxin